MADPIPANLAAVQADDALLDALLIRVRVPEITEDQLVQMLLAWRAEVDSEPMPRLMDTDTALAVVARACGLALRSRSARLVSAAVGAVLVIAASGVCIGAYFAQPGDRLWSATKILYPKRAEHVRAPFDARICLRLASNALEGGWRSVAAAPLAQARDSLERIRDEGQRRMLTEWHDQLRAKLSARP